MRWLRYGCALLLLGGSAAVHGCNSDARDPFLVIPFDAGRDGEAGGSDAEGEIDPTLGGPCTEDGQCDDAVVCTFDACDKTLGRCRNTPDDAQCDDGEYCNGVEKCKLRQGCVAGPVVTCQDSDGCTIDRCIEATKSCEHVPRDSDGDGDPDDHCQLNRDCDDTDPTVSSTATEICGNFKDDNCNGQIDEQPCSAPANDNCSTALKVTAPGTFLLTTVAAKKDYSTSCSVPNPTAARDIVVEITVPPGDAKDVVVFADSSRPPVEIALALGTTCGVSASEVQCVAFPNVANVRAIARRVPGGEKRYAIITTQRETNVDVRVAFETATDPPTNESCTAPKPVALETSFPVSIIDAVKDHPSSCEPRTGELSYSFTLDTPRDVQIFATTVSGIGQPVVSLRDSSCTTERRCRVGATPPVFVRSLPAGTHTFLVAGTAQLDANVVVRTFPPTLPPADQTCPTSPVAVLNKQFSVNLADHEDGIENGCHPGNPDAAYRIQLAVASDVLILGRWPTSELGAIAFHSDALCKDKVTDCAVGGAPQRISKRNVAAGDHFVVISDQKALNTELVVMTRPTTPPVTVTSDDCASNITTIPETGGFFIGNTTGAAANFNGSCDSPGQPIGSAPDQIMKMVLTQRRRVIFDMIGSSHDTLLVIRQGVPCPGTELEDGCSSGSAQRAFRDMHLDPGEYYVQIDGYNGSVGTWQLDVRTLDPSF